MTVANLGRQHQRSLNSYFKSSWECLYLFGVITYYFIPSILLKLIVYISKLLLLMFLYTLDSAAILRHFVILMRRQNLHNTTFFMFPKHVILKKENNRMIWWESQLYILREAIWSNIPSRWVVSHKWHNLHATNTC